MTRFRHVCLRHMHIVVLSRQAAVNGTRLTQLQISRSFIYRLTFRFATGGQHCQRVLFSVTSASQIGPGTVNCTNFANEILSAFPGTCLMEAVRIGTACCNREL